MVFLLSFRENIFHLFKLIVCDAVTRHRMLNLLKKKATEGRGNS